MNRTKVPNFTESFNRSTMSAQNPGSAAAPSPVPVPLPVFIPPPTTLLAPLYHQTARPEPLPTPSAVPGRELSVVQHAAAPAPGSESGILGWFKQNYGKVLLCVLLLIVVTILLVRRMTFFKNRQKLKKEQEDEEEDSADIKDDEWESFFGETSTLNQGQGSDAENHAPPPHHPQPPPVYPHPQHQAPPSYPHHEFYGPSSPPPPGAQSYRFPAPHPLSFPVPRSSSPPPSSPVNSTSGMTPLPPLPPQAPAPAPAQASGQRGNVQPRFAPPESINAAAFMPPSMMPESTRPVRELSSDATFTVNTEEIPITVNPEAQEESKKKSADAAGAPGPDV